jgi:hypothetical protein
LLDPGGFALGTGQCPRVAYNGSHHVVVWADASVPNNPTAVRAARVTRAGTLLDHNPIVVQSPGSHPDVASFGDGRALIVYQRPDLADIRNADRIWVRALSDNCDCNNGTCDVRVCLGPAIDAGREGGTLDASVDHTDGGNEPASDSGGDASSGGTGAEGGASGGGPRDGASGALGAAGLGGTSASQRDAATGTGGSGAAAKPSRRAPSADEGGCSISSPTGRTNPWHLVGCVALSLVLAQSRKGSLGRFLKGRRRASTARRFRPSHVDRHDAETGYVP